MSSASPDPDRARHADDGPLVVRLVTSGAPHEGRGHVARTLSLAEALARAAAIPVVELLRGEPTAFEAAELARLAATSRGRHDAGVEPASIVVDLPDPNEVADRWPADRLVVLDDRELLRGRAAIVIQPSLPAWSGEARAGRVLAGYAYAPVRAGLRRLAANPPPLADPPEIAVCFGGSDPADVAARIVPTIATAAGGAARVTAIVGPGYGGALAPGRAWDVVRDPPDLAERLGRATVALIGGGTMKFELALLGVPAVVLAVADDQLPVGPPFAASGAALFLGDGRSIDPSEAAGAVTRLLSDATARRVMSRLGRSLVDGRGAERIAAAVLDLTRAG